MISSRALLLLSLVATTASAAADKAGCVDHPLIPTRMPGYWIEACKTAEFDGYECFVAKGPKHREEGKFTFLTYAIDRKDEQAALAVVRNFENAITKVGGTVVASDPQRWVNGKVDDNQKLSQARAKAVVTALTTTHGIAASRRHGSRATGWGRSPPRPATRQRTAGRRTAALGDAGVQGSRWCTRRRGPRTEERSLT